MTNKELVINIIRKLPEDTSIEQILDELKLLPQYAEEKQQQMQVKLSLMKMLRRWLLRGIKLKAKL